VANFALVSVFVVARTPTTPDLVVAAAGLTAGSMATMGNVKVDRNESTATAVAVLQATTIDVAPWPMRNSTTERARCWTKAAGRSPYGA
jgi:hypothetical protein